MQPQPLPSFGDVGDDDDRDGADFPGDDPVFMAALEEEFGDEDDDGGCDGDVAAGGGGTQPGRSRFCGNVPSDSVVAKYLQSVRNDILNQRSTLHQQVKSGNNWIQPPCAIAAMNRKQTLAPDTFYHPRVFVFIPHLTYPHLAIKCPHCATAVCHYFIVLFT